MKNEPSLKEWRKLYEAAMRVKKIAPWNWMDETDIFGVQNPETDETGFVSVMGAGGEHFAIGVYLGLRALYGFWDLQNEDPSEVPERVIEIRQLQAAFEDRKALSKRDHETIKKLGLKFRGRKEWPKFQSYRPGYWPYHLEAEEVRFMVHALEQTYEIALRFKENSSILEFSDEESYFVRIPSRTNGGAMIWEDRILAIPPESLQIPISLVVEDLEKLKRLPQSNHKLEMDFFLFPTNIGKIGQRPACPYSLLIMEAGLNLILHTEMLMAEPSLEIMWGSIPGHLVFALTKAGFRPKEISVRTDLLVHLLRPLAKELDFKLKQSELLPVVEHVKEEMFRFMGPG